MTQAEAKLSPDSRKLLDKLIQDYGSRVPQEERVLESNKGSAYIYNLFQSKYEQDNHQETCLPKILHNCEVHFFGFNGEHYEMKKGGHFQKPYAIRYK